MYELEVCTFRGARDFWRDKKQYESLDHAVDSGRLVNFEKHLKLDEFDTSEPQGDWRFRELVGILMRFDL